MRKELTSGDAAKAATAYTCPMHPEVQSATPGKCPKCGMKLEEKKKESAAVYTCPMHPEVQSATAGRCPTCNMKLEQKK